MIHKVNTSKNSPTSATSCSGYYYTGGDFYYKQVEPVIPNSARNLLVAIILLIATSFSAKAQYIPSSAVSTSGNTTTITIPSTGTINKTTTMSGSCPAGTNVIINNPDNHNYSMSGTFQYCSSLEKVVINGNVTNIVGAFTDCASLKEVTINGNVTYNMSYAFRYCYNLSTITFTQTTPPSYMTDAFALAGRDVAKVVVNLPFGANKADWRTKLIAAGIPAGKLTINLTDAPPRNKTKIGRLNIKQGKVEIKPRE